MGVRVDRCLCTGRTFAELREQARANGLGFDALVRSTHAGATCGLCRPYLKRMLRTGEVVFTELLSEADE